MAMLYESMRQRLVARGALNFRTYADLAAAYEERHLVVEGHEQHGAADAGRTGGDHHAVERAVHAVDVEGRTGAGRRQPGDPQAGRVVAAVGVAARRPDRRGRLPARGVQRRAGHRRGGRPAARRRPARASGSASPGRPRRRATSAGPPPRTSCRSRPSSAARARWSCSPTPTSTPPRTRRPGSTTTPGRSAWPARGCSSRRRCATSSSTRFTATSTRHVLGDSRDPATTIAPMIHPDHVARVHGFVERARRPATDRARRRAASARSLHVEPTLIEPASNDSEVVQREVFGPVLTFQTFADEDDAVELANSTPYGLSAIVFTSSQERAERVGRAIRAGHRVGQHVPRPRPHRAVRRHRACPGSAARAATTPSTSTAT